MDRGKLVSVLAEGHRPVQNSMENTTYRTWDSDERSKEHMLSRPSDEGCYVSETEIATRVTRHTDFESIKHHERDPGIQETERGGTEDCPIIAGWWKSKVALLHTKTDRGTVVPYTYNEIGERTITPHGRMWMIRKYSTRTKLHLHLTVGILLYLKKLFFFQSWEDRFLQSIFLWFTLFFRIDFSIVFKYVNNQKGGNKTFFFCKKKT